MTIRITLGTLAAAGVATFCFLVPRGSSAAFDFAKVQREVAAARTVTFTSTVTFDGKPSFVDRIFYSAPDHSRVESEKRYTVIDRKAKKIMTVDTANKSASLENMTTMPSSSDMYTLFKEIARDPIETLPERKINGKRSLGFVSTWHAGEVSIWVDPRTKLPMRIEQTRKELGHTLERVMENFVFDQPLDPSLFQLNLPEGYIAPSLTPILTSGAKFLPLPNDLSLAKAKLSPGVGIGPARFGMTKAQVVSVLGQPDHEYEQGRTTYLVYRSRGFELTVQPNDRPRPGLSCIKCVDHEDNPVQPFHRFQGKTDKDISLGTSRADVVAAYGEPDPEGGSEVKVAPDAVESLETIRYRKLGLGFELLQAKVSRITLEAIKANATAKP